MKAKAQTVEVQVPIWKDQVFWFVIALGVGYGAVYNFLPASFPAFTRQFNCSLAQLGQIQLLFFLSGLAFSVVGGPVVARLGLKRSAMVAFAIAGGALLLIAESRHFAVVLIGSVLFGFAISAMVVINSSIISGHFSERRQSVFLITGLSDAGGSMIGPAMLGWWLGNSTRWGLSWRVGYFTAAADMGALILWALFVRSRTMGRDRSGHDAGGKVVSHTHQILVSGALYIAVVLGFCHGLAQAGMLSFVGQLYINKLHIDAAHAAYFISGNAAGMLSGRLMFGWITAHCVMAGIFVSTIGPSLNSYLGGKFAKGTATAFSLFAGLSNLGAAFGPFIIGIIGTHLGVGKGIFFAPAFSTLLSAMALLWFLRERTKSGTPEMSASLLPG